nr:two-pore potassium channel 1-like [Malus domestica]
MASNESRSLVSGLIDPLSQTNKRNAPKGRRIRRCRSAPLSEYIRLEAGFASGPRTESFCGNIHPNFLFVAAFLTVYLGIGTLCFYLVRHQLKGEKTNGLLDAVYFCIVTMTTVGYGDLVPNSVLSKLLACAFVFSGMALVGMILSKAADYLVEKQELLLVKALHMSKKVGHFEILKDIETNSLRTNYPLWLAQILPILKSRDLMGYVDGTLVCPPKNVTGATTLNPSYTAWVQQDQMILSWINGSLTASVLFVMASKRTARATWEALEQS